jgi:DNA polymerase sigma
LFKALTQPTDGMECVICIPQAKVRIVRVWDPESELACDMYVEAEHEDS